MERRAYEGALIFPIWWTYAFSFSPFFLFSLVMYALAADTPEFFMSVLCHDGAGEWHAWRGRHCGKHGGGDKPNLVIVQQRCEVMCDIPMAFSREGMAKLRRVGPGR